MDCTGNWKFKCYKVIYCSINCSDAVKKIAFLGESELLILNVYIFFLREVDLRHPNLVYFLEIKESGKVVFLTHLTDWSHSYSVAFGDRVMLGRVG